MSQNGEYDFIELDRSFHELSKWASENDDHDLTQAFAVGPVLKWPDLLSNFRTIILSEAGSGKTAEIRHQAKMLEKVGKPSFFLRLENIGQNFDIAFEVGTPETFETWLGTIEEGWVFLDSVDEARLKSPIDFQIAIRHVGRRLMKALDRTRIVITGRSSAWRARSDHTLCVEHLPVNRLKTRSLSSDRASDNETAEVKDEPPTSAFKVVTLDNLTQNQIEVFAQKSGITDTKRLLTAIERADANSSTLRPQDLFEVVSYWKKYEKIGTRFELMQFSISQRLSERDPDRGELKPLSTQTARRAAQLVAAAATLAKAQTILIPNHEPGLPGINLDSVLPEWNAQDQTTLLSRPIFDDAIYGAVRFYHRTVREYLTAEWLNELLKKQTSRRQIYQLLFRNQYGLDVIPPTMRPILAWLVLFDEGVLNRVLKIAPEVVLEGGDPARLPIDVRRSLLNDVCTRVASGKSGRTIYDYGAVQRFASNDIADEVSALLKKYRRHEDISWFLLRMVWIGELKSCLTQSKLIALDARSPMYTRISAFKAVDAVGTLEDQIELRKKFLAERGMHRREWIGELLAGSVHSPETVIWLLQCIQRAQDKRRHSSDQLQHEFVNWIISAPESLLLPIISAFVPLLSKKPVKERRYCDISIRYEWLMKPLCKAVERLINSRNEGALTKDVLTILHKIPTAKTYDIDISSTQRSELRPLVKSWPELNRALFWYAVDVARLAASREKPRKRITNPWEAATFDDLWSFDTSDFSYFVNTIEHRSAPDDKLIALTLAIKISQIEKASEDWKQQLLEVSGKHPKLAERLELYLNPPPPTAVELKWQKQEKVWKEQGERRQSKQEANAAEWRELLQKIPEKIRDPGLPNPEDISRPQWYLLQVLREKKRDLARWSYNRWEMLVDDFGEEVAKAFRDGTVGYWRRHKPKIRSEGAPANSTTHRVVFGLTGLEIEASSNSAWLERMSVAEAMLACRYASHEINGFPPWFSKVFEKFPQVVTDFILQEIAYELRVSKPNEDIHYILSDVSWSGEWLWEAIAPSLFQNLKSYEPQSLFSLEKVLKIIQGSPSVSDHDLAALASRKARTLRRNEHAARWFAVWTGIDPLPAIASLQKKLGAFRNSVDATSFAMVFVQNLVGERSRQAPKTRIRFQTPGYLKDLYLLMHQYVRRSDDIDRSGGGAYSPGLRDDAQEARDGIFSLLNSIPGKEAFIAIEEISRLHPDEASRSYMFQHALAKAQTDADLAPWAANDVAVFNDQLERTPADHRSLAELVVARLLDMKDELEEGDTSLAKLLLVPSFVETDLRLYFAREFREKANGRYVAPQEEELADAKRPDVRIHGHGFDAPVPVELKLADKWSGAKLFERFRNQLGGDYLRDSRSSRGVFLLVWRGEQKSWVIPGQKRAISFEELIVALQNYWKILASEYPAVEELTVVGIDLTKRGKASNEPIHTKLVA